MYNSVFKMEWVDFRSLNGIQSYDRSFEITIESIVLVLRSSTDRNVFNDPLHDRSDAICSD